MDRLSYMGLGRRDFLEGFVGQGLVWICVDYRRDMEISKRGLLMIDKEKIEPSVMAELRNTKSIPMRCRFGFHKWGIWVDATMRGKVHIDYLTGEVFDPSRDYCNEIQLRWCVLCRKKDKRKA